MLLLSCMYFLTCCPGFFSHGEWQELQTIVDPALMQQCAMLPAIALQDRAPSTVKSYLWAFCRWRRWAESHQLSPLPARGAHITLYGAYLLHSANSASPINVAAAAITWAHGKAGAKDPTSSLLAQQIISGAHGILAAPTKKKQPWSPGEIQSVISILIKPDTDLATLQTVTLIVLGFCSFLRWDELHRLSRQCLQFFPTHIALHRRLEKQHPARRSLGLCFPYQVHIMSVGSARKVSVVRPSHRRPTVVL